MPTDIIPEVCQQIHELLGQSMVQVLPKQHHGLEVLWTGPEEGDYVALASTVQVE